MRPVIGILAAGGSTRMRGGDKLLEVVGGETLLARQVRLARECGVPVLVALPPGDVRRTAIVGETGAQPVVVGAIPPGMGDLIAALTAEAERAEADTLLLVLADMPEIEAEDIRAVLAAVAEADAGTVVRAAAADGRPGHPVAFRREHFAGLRRLRGDVGAREVIEAAAAVRLVPLAGERALTDLDTPEAWAAWRASRAE